MDSDLSSDLEQWYANTAFEYPHASLGLSARRYLSHIVASRERILLRVRSGSSVRLGRSTFRPRTTANHRERRQRAAAAASAPRRVRRKWIAAEFASAHNILTLSAFSLVRRTCRVCVYVCLHHGVAVLIILFFLKQYRRSIPPRGSRLSLDARTGDPRAVTRDTGKEDDALHRSHFPW